ncbi:copper chaperone PCu(A)C [Modestobacter lapidis]|nr:copper chaperone PCu(A)C [Modestobacter lapidis]
METRATHRSALRRWLLPTACCSALLLAGCSSDAPIETPQAEVPGGAIGPDAPVSEDVKLLQVQLEYPLDGAYEVGEDASLFLGIANTGREADTLIDVSGPDFAGAESSPPGGAAAATDGVSIEVAAEDNVYVGAEGAPSLTLLGLERELLSSESIPVTFTFERAGEVTIDAMVAAEGQTPVPTFDFPNPDEDPTDDSTE